MTLNLFKFEKRKFQQNIAIFVTFNSQPMNNKKLTDRMLAIFGATMVFFYLGLGIFILVSPILNLDKSLRIIFAVPLLLYGIYRVFTSVSKIRESFMDGDEED